MITSKSNETIKYARKLKEKKFSKKEGKCLVESIKLVRELHELGMLESILIDEEKKDLISDIHDIKIEYISKEIVAYLTDAMTSDGVFAICKICRHKAVDYHRCIVLDGIQDPSNIGAIIRSAKAFGFDTIFAINCVYPYSFKGIRASMGQIFKVNYIDVTLDMLNDIKNTHDIELIVADMDGVEMSKFHAQKSNLAIVIGNEGNGVSRELRDMAESSISIPMNSDVESLNASVSAGIIMYLLK